MNLVHAPHPLRHPLENKLSSVFTVTNVMTIEIVSPKTMAAIHCDVKTIEPMVTEVIDTRLEHTFHDRDSMPRHSHGTKSYHHSFEDNGPNPPSYSP